MSILTLYQDVKTHLRDKLPKTIAKTVDFYAGEFDEAEVKVSSFNAPAVLLTVMGWKPSTDNRYDPKTGRDVRLGAFVIIKNKKNRNQRSFNALVLSELIESHLIHWRNPCAGKASNFRTENLYSHSFDKQGLTVWLVTWFQATEIVTGDDTVLFDYLETAVTSNSDGTVAHSTADMTGDP